MSKKMNLVIPTLVYEEIMFYVDRSPVEVSGLGTLTHDKETNTFRVGQVVLLEQENTASTTDIPEEAVAKAMYDLRDAEGELRFWWHSHVNMGVFWSGTDKTTMCELAEHGWFLSTVFNKKREMKTCLSFKDQTLEDTFGESRINFCDDIDTFIEEEEHEYAEQWEANYKSKCKTKTYASTYKGNTNSAWSQTNFLPDEFDDYDNALDGSDKFVTEEAKAHNIECWDWFTPEQKKVINHLNVGRCRVLSETYIYYGQYEMNTDKQAFDMYKESHDRLSEVEKSLFKRLVAMEGGEIEDDMVNPVSEQDVNDLCDDIRDGVMQ